MNSYRLLNSICVFVLLLSTTRALGDTAFYDEDLPFPESITPDFLEVWHPSYSPHAIDLLPYTLAPTGETSAVTVESKAPVAQPLNIERAKSPLSSTVASPIPVAVSEQSKDAVTAMQESIAGNTKKLAALESTVNRQMHNPITFDSWQKFFFSELFASLVCLALVAGIVYYVSRPDGTNSSDESEAMCANTKLLSEAERLLGDQQDCSETHDLPSPAASIDRLLESMHDSPIRRKLSEGRAAWETGFAQRVGPREEQQDYLHTFKVGEFSCCVLADGCGGHDCGKAASYVAVQGATASLCDLLAFWPKDRELNLEKIARKSVEDASLALSAHAGSHGISKENSLRSTIIVFIANQEEFAWTNLGDGGGWTMRVTPQRFESFLTLAKGAQQNQLLSSLGPDIRGKISSGTKPWDDTDFVCLASDGVADIIDDDTLVSACISASLVCQGDLLLAAEHVLDLLSASPNVTDNMSLAFIGRGLEPILVAQQLHATSQPQLLGEQPC